MGPPEHLRPPEERTPENRASRRTIVGVVADVKGSSLNRPSSTYVYSQLTQHWREGWATVSVGSPKQRQT